LHQFAPSWWLLFGFLFASMIWPNEGRKLETVKSQSLRQIEVIAPDEVYRYNICNGLSNQLLYHAASIATAIEQNSLVVEIPNYYIVNGVQMTNDDVLPSGDNSVPFAVVFDADYFIQKVQELGIQARLVSFDLSHPHHTPITCAGMGALLNADAQSVRQILTAFRPSALLQTNIQSMTNALQGRNGQEQGAVCVHHRDGSDWHAHCKRWGSIPDGVYRGNCLGVPDRTFVQSLEDRGLKHDRLVYYCGDHKIPTDLDSPESAYTAIAREHILGDDDRRAIEKVVLSHMSSTKTSGVLVPTERLRDLWALIDFYVCQSIPHFIGNSVSTFSAIQIALRQAENSYWYVFARRS
jgi:hypothetical protein